MQRDRHVHGELLSAAHARHALIVVSTNQKSEALRIYSLLREVTKLKHADELRILLLTKDTT